MTGVPSLAVAIVILLSALQTEVHAELYFAYHEGQLYAQIARQFEDRATASLFGFLQIASRLGQLSVHGHLNHVSSDMHSDVAWGVRLGFWREPGTEDRVMALWPNFDYWGWGFAWIPPDTLVSQQFAREMPSWDKRPMDRIYWTGARGVHIRNEFVKCAEQLPRSFYADVIDWDEIRRDDGQSLLTTKWGTMKPVMFDMRKLLAPKFLIYLHGATWSTSLKRIISAGAVVLLPSAGSDPHEDLWKLKLGPGCKDCFLYYNPAKLCLSAAVAMEQVLRNASAAGAMAARLQAFVDSELTLEKMHEHMAGTLLRLAPKHPWPSNATTATISGQEVLIIQGRTLPKVTCPTLKQGYKELLGPRAWQVDEWYDDRCQLRATDYMRFVAL